MAAISSKKALAVPLPTDAAQDAFQAFVNVKSGVTGASEESKQETLSKIWKSASSDTRKKIEDAYPGSQEQYGAGRRRSSRKTKKTRRGGKKSHKRRHH